jgi:hypothetical protein
MCEVCKGSFICNESYPCWETDCSVLLWYSEGGRYHICVPSNFAFITYVPSAKMYNEYTIVK